LRLRKRGEIIAAGARIGGIEEDRNQKCAAARKTPLRKLSPIGKKCGFALISGRFRAMQYS